MNNIQSIIKKYKKDIYSVAFMLVIITIFLAIFYKWDQFDLNVPFHYGTYGDSIGPMGKAKLLSESFKAYLYERWAAPFGSNVSTNYPTILSNTTSLAYIILSFFVEEPGKIVNIYFFSLFYFIALSMYITMRQIKIREWISLLGSLNFALLPYIFFRGSMHLVLSEYQFIPFVFLICFWMMFDESYLKFQRGFWRNPKNIFTLIVCIFIANNGIGYYPFFSCFFFCIIGLYMIVQKRYKELWKIVKVIFGVVANMIVAVLPAISYKLSHSEQKEVISRSYREVEEYSLSLVRMFIPTNSHGIPFLEELSSKLGTLSWANENTSAYIGIIGIIGFCTLILCLLKKKRDTEYDEKMHMLSMLLILACLFATIDGFNMIFSFLVTDTMRTYTRISVFIACICILAFGLYAENILTKVKGKNSRIVGYAVIIMLFVIGSLEQIPTNMKRDYAEDIAKYYSDQKFIKEIEASLPEDSMIFQLPVQLYPEGGYNSNLIGFIHSDSLRWSYGALKSEGESSFLQAVASLQVEEMLDTLAAIGYTGICVDIEAYGMIGTYAETDGEMLVEQLQSLLGEDAIYNANGKKVFFNLQNYREQMNISEDEWEEKRERLLGNEAPKEYYAGDFSKYLLENASGIVQHLQGVTPNLSDKQENGYVWLRDEFSIALKVGNKKEVGILLSYSVLEALYAVSEEDTKMEIYVDGELIESHILTEVGEQTLYIPGYKLPAKEEDETYKFEIKLNQTFVPSQLPDYFPGSTDNEEYSICLKSIEEGDIDVPLEFSWNNYEQAITEGVLGTDGEYVWVSDSFSTFLEAGNKSETGLYIYYAMPTALVETAKQKLGIVVYVNEQKVKTQEIKEAGLGYCYISKDELPAMREGDSIKIEIDVNNYFIPAMEPEYYPENTDMRRYAFQLESITGKQKSE